MARMPSGHPQTVPDPAGDLYDREMAKLRAQRASKEQGAGSAIKAVTKAFHDFQHGPRIPRPNTLETFIPVIGPAWEAFGDIQDGNYVGAAFNAGAAVADVLPISAGVKGLKALDKGIGVLKSGSVTADAARKALRRAGMAGPGEEIHHSIPLNGLGRNVQDWRNHYAFLKKLPVEQHRRLTGSWQGKPKYDPIRRAFIGTTDWMKAIPADTARYAASASEALHDRPEDAQKKP